VEIEKRREEKFDSDDLWSLFFYFVSGQTDILQPLRFVDLVVGAALWADI
jgi:hypothetical protein